MTADPVGVVALPWRARAVVVTSGMVAAVVAAGLGLTVAASRPAGPEAGPVVVGLHSHGLHVGDVVTWVAAFGTAAGLVSGVADSVVNRCRPRSVGAAP